MLSDKLGKIAFWLAFTGFNIAFLPMHITGLARHATARFHLSGRSSVLTR